MMRICDAHLHYGLRRGLETIVKTSPLAAKYPCYQTVQFENMDGCEEEFKTHNVEKTVVVPFVFREQDKMEENKRVLDFAKQDEARRFPYALLDESNTSFISEHRGDYVGVKEHIVLHQSVLTKEKFVILEQLRDYKMTLLLHSERARRLEYVKGLLENLPGIKVQIAHMGRGLPGDIAMIYAMLDAFAGDENVTFDTSTTRDPEVIEAAVNKIGSERILYGSDFPFYIESPSEDIMGAQTEQIMRAKITDKQREDIFYNNFSRWINRGI